MAINQGPWTRIRPLQKNEMDPHTLGGVAYGESTWGGFPTNLLKVMAYCPRLTQTEVPYANSFIFDPPTFRGGVQQTGFNSRFLKELVISRTSLVNRSAYSVTHHSLIGMGLYSEAGCRSLGHQKYKQLHEHEKHLDLYTPLEQAVLNYTVKLARDEHSVTDSDFASLREALHYDNQVNGRSEVDVRNDSKQSQGPWGRIRPLQRDLMEPYTRGGMEIAEFTWGGGTRFPNNLCKVMAYLPGLMQTEVVYANSFIFDPPSFRGDVQEAGFLDRTLKELVISKTSLINRSRYSITHHSAIGLETFRAAGRGDEGHEKLLNLHQHEKHREIYTDLENIVLDFTANLVRDAHLVTDAQFEQLRDALRAHNLQDSQLRKLPDMSRHVDAQIVELSWLIGHYCLLNRWFTVLQVPDEGSDDELDFLAGYESVPKDIRDRNDEVLGADQVQWNSEPSDLLVDRQIVELTWLTCHFCLLNRWFTVLQVPDEGPEDEADFGPLYHTVVPNDIRERNSRILGNATVARPNRHPNAALLQEYVDAWLKGDVAKAESFYADDCTLHHFGLNPLAGDYRGKKAMDDYIQKMLERTDKAETLKVYDVYGNDEGGVTVIRVRFEKAGKEPLEGVRITKFRIGNDRKIHDVWVRDEDQYAVDKFFS